MPRKFLSKFLPDREKLHQRLHGKWYMRPFDFLMHDPALWHIGRSGTSKALALGMFICCLPIPGHMVLAVLGSLYFRINMPVAVAAVWVNNPLTIGPIYYVAFKLGKYLLHLLHAEPDIHGMPHEGLMPELARAWHILEPVFLGGVIEGLVFAVVGYAVLDLTWRLSINGRWRLRRKARRTTRKAKD